jgi:hypothetical protein
MPKYRLTQKTAVPKRHRVTGKTSAFLTAYAQKPQAPVPLAPVPVPAVVPPVKKVTRMCKVTIERPGKAPEVYHTRSMNETMK